jgi:hypothetical protein
VSVPPGDFLEWIRKTPQGSVIASFMGPPWLSPIQRSQLGEIKPRIVAFCSGNLAEPTDLRALLKQGLLHAAVVSRPNPLPSSATRRGMQGWFDQSYLILTATDVDHVAPQPDHPADRRSP